jgi:hypothetical protein
MDHLGRLAEAQSIIHSQGVVGQNGVGVEHA